MGNLPVTTESLNSNGGAMTVTRAVLPPGATAVMHYHTEYSETFKVLQGNLVVIRSGKEYKIKSGQQSPIIEITDIHTYKNNSNTDAIVDIIVEPGHAGCESANLILAALERENKMDLVNKKYSLFRIAFYEITNTIPVGGSSYLFAALKRYYGRKKIDRYKEYLLGKV